MEETKDMLFAMTSREFFTWPRALKAGIIDCKENRKLITTLSRVGSHSTVRKRVYTVKMLVHIMDTDGVLPNFIGPKIWALARQIFEHNGLLLPLIPSNKKRKK